MPHDHLTRARCSCGRTIWRGPLPHLGGAGLARYWVRTNHPAWRHIDDRTPACDPPGDYAEAGHWGGGAEQLLLIILLVIFILVGLRLLGVAL